MSSIGQDIQEHEVVIFDFTETAYMDDSAAMVIEQMIDVALDEGHGTHRNGVVRLRRA